MLLGNAARPHAKAPPVPRHGDDDAVLDAAPACCLVRAVEEADVRGMTSSGPWIQGIMDTDAEEGGGR